MLVLSRKRDQEILIGDQIKITVLKTRGNTVRLGIDAPRDIKVIRGELPPEQSSEDGPQENQDTNDSAEFTIVFDTEAEPNVSSDSDNVQFGTDRNTRSGQQCAQASPQRTARMSNTNTVQFQGRMPRVLKHNRLKEIVDRIAVENGARQNNG